MLIHNFKSIIWQLWNLSGLAEQNNAEQLESLFKAGESVLSLIDFREIDGCTPFLRAAKHGSLDALKALTGANGTLMLPMLLKTALTLVFNHTAAGANVEVADNCGLTAFHLAAEGGRTEILQYLCSDEGRDLFPDFNGMFKAVSQGVEWSAIHYAAERGHASACRVLLENGASASPRSKKLWTPLMLAASHGHREAIEALLPYACDLGATDPRTFESALHLACKNGFHASARLLLEAGCRMTLDWQGRTPLAHALGNNFPWDVAVTPLQALPSMQTKLVRLQQDFVAADEARIAAEAELRRTKQQLEAIRAEFNQSQLEIYRLRHVDHSGDANKHEVSFSTVVTLSCTVVRLDNSTTQHNMHSFQNTTTKDVQPSSTRCLTMQCPRRAVFSSCALSMRSLQTYCLCFTRRRGKSGKTTGIIYTVS